MTRIESLILGLTCGTVSSVLTMLLMSPAHAQKAERGTQQWVLPIENPADYRLRSVQIHVVDTNGVCLYVARDTNGYGEGWTPALAMVAVPKTQLPQGAGCQ